MRIKGECHMKAPKVPSHIKSAHIDCEKDKIAKTVIMPGDPLRAKYIAEKYLKNAELVTRARNMLGYTGEYNGKRVTVMAHGMGMSGASIYFFELYYFFGVEKIIRIGTCGGLIPELEVPSLIIANKSYTEANFAYSYNGDLTHISYPSKDLTNKIKKVANEKGLPYTEGCIVCTEQFGFYSDNEHVLNRVPKYLNPIAEEMETFALFHIANSFDKEAAAIVTVVDSKFSEKFMSIEEREKSMDDMILLALDSLD